jgi:hypothetical protein
LNSRNLKIFSGVIVIVALLWIVSLPSKPSSHDEAQPLPEKLSSPTPEKIQAKSKIPSGTPSENSDQEDTHEVSPPTLAKVAEEVRQDPHSTPPSLLRFASDLGAQMNEAIQSESSAKAFFSQLEECIRGQGGQATAKSAQAICLSDAKRLGSRYESLS